MKTLEDESRLTIEACHGSTAAFEALVIYYEPRIRRMLYSLTHDIQLTQDLCQETFLAAFRALPRMKGEELQFAPWIYRIALNQLRSEWRRRRRITWVPFTSPSGQGDDLSELPPEEALVSDEHFEEQVMERDLVARVLAQLPPASATCLLLDAEGFSYREIAEIMQDSLPAVRSRLARSRQAFQQAYKRLDRGGQS
ncbi:RNA polymerase sigma factor [Thermogemmatispora sp.]|uniref:RNA polymerase sigma factor n=1 Tax=Thermogemmatispora sp. TaxID=1968838 RepID=UPI0035E43DD1